MTPDVSLLTGHELGRAFPTLARLRIQVFRDFPYLYDGTPEYEEEYLSALAKSRDSIIALARDNDQIVGCATGSALDGHHDEFVAPFHAKGFDPSQFFYCGESVLDPKYRGRGLGHRFFDTRESHATERGYKYCTFCAVIRPADHPLKPAGYTPLDPFWKKRGYRKVEGLVAMFRWKEINSPLETEHAMQFWMRELT